MITLKENSRTLLVPDDEKYFGVESDEKVESRQFEIPKMTANGMDLSAFALRINYFNASNVPGQYLVKDAEVNGDMISFSWEFSRKVTAAAGKVLFIICAVSLDESGEIVNEWNTEPAEGTVGKGLEVSSSSDEEDDIPAAVESALLLISQRAQEVIDSIPADYAALVAAVDELKSDIENVGSPTDEQVANAINGYFDKNPLPTGTCAYVTPSDYGAIGDGVTDDTDALTRCLNSGNPIVFEKNYYISGEIEVTSIVLNINANGYKIISQSSESMKSVILINGVFGVIIKDLSLVSTADQTPVPIGTHSPLSGQVSSNRYGIKVTGNCGTVKIKNIKTENLMFDIFSQRAAAIYVDGYKSDNCIMGVYVDSTNVVDIRNFDITHDPDNTFPGAHSFYTCFGINYADIHDGRCVFENTLNLQATPLITNHQTGSQGQINKDIRYRDIYMCGQWLSQVSESENILFENCHFESYYPDDKVAFTNHGVFDWGCNTLVKGCAFNLDTFDYGFSAYSDEYTLTMQECDIQSDKNGTKVLLGNQNGNYKIDNCQIDWQGQIRYTGQPVAFEVSNSIIKSPVESGYLISTRNPNNVLTRLVNSYFDCGSGYLMYNGNADPANIAIIGCDIVGGNLITDSTISNVDIWHTYLNGNLIGGSDNGGSVQNNLKIIELGFAADSTEEQPKLTLTYDEFKEYVMQNYVFKIRNTLFTVTDIHTSYVDLKATVGGTIFTATVTQNDTEALMTTTQTALSMVVDADFSADSENPVQNKVVYNAFNNLPKIHEVVFSAASTEDNQILANSYEDYQNKFSAGYAFKIKNIIYFVTDVHTGYMTLKATVGTTIITVTITDNDGEAVLTTESEQISDLIDNALGVIENGTY